VICRVQTDAVNQRQPLSWHGDCQEYQLYLILLAVTHKEQILMDKQHEMHLEATHPSGAEEWACPICGMRYLLQWPPAYKKVVLQTGDEYAYHSCSKGDLAIERVSLSQDQAQEPVSDAANITSGQSADDSLDHDDSMPADTLQPWLKWLAVANLDAYLGDAA